MSGYLVLSQAGLVGLPLDRLLAYLKSLARRDFLSNPDSGVFKVVLDKLKDKNPTALDQALKASNLTASQILIHHTKVGHHNKNTRVCFDPN